MPPSRHASSVVYVDMDDVLCAYSASHAKALLDNPSVRFPQGTPGFFLALQPIEGAIDSVNELRTTFDVYILSAPSTRNPHSYSEKRLWIEEHFDYALTKRLILCPHKGLLKGDYLIDDHASGKGQEQFDGTLIEFGSAEFPDWTAVLAFLKIV